MNGTNTLLRSLRTVSLRRPAAAQCTCRPSPFLRQFRSSAVRRAEKPQPGDDPNFVSILDTPPQLVRSKRQHGPGLIILALIPITALALGTWQIQRLGWKTDLIKKFEDRLVRDPLPLPPSINPEAVHEFDYRRVVATGTFRHDQEMLIGPRMRDGQDGYLVITPLEREGGTTILVNRGWISKKHRNQKTRPDSLPTGVVSVEGLLREPWKKNMFTPDNKPEKGEFYFPDVKQMAELTGSQPVWIEATMGMYSPSVHTLQVTNMFCRARVYANGRFRGPWHPLRTSSRGQSAQQPCPVHLHMVQLGHCHVGDAVLGGQEAVVQHRASHQGGAEPVNVFVDRKVHSRKTPACTIYNLEQNKNRFKVVNLPRQSAASACESPAEALWANVSEREKTWLPRW